MEPGKQIVIEIIIVLQAVLSIFIKLLWYSFEKFISCNF